jgi:biopolymer transport protein ExbB
MKHSMSMKLLRVATVLTIAIAPAWAAQATPAKSSESFDNAAASLQRQLQDSVAELSQLRDRIANEKIPLAKKISDLESELSQARQNFQATTRLLDGRALDLTNLRGEIKSRGDETAYLSTLLSEYGRNFESRLHITELQRYAPQIEAAKLAPENTALSSEQVFQAQAAMLSTSLDRLQDSLGGTRFEGTAVAPDGTVHRGTFALVGPVAVFRSADGKAIGTAEQRLGSLEPAQVPFARPEDALAAAQLLTTGAGQMPVDPTLGNAHKVASTEETLWEHIQKGGPVMWPIFILAGAALLVALYKWIALAFLRNPSKKAVDELLATVGRHDDAQAKQQVLTMRGPVGTMLAAGVSHIDEPRELVEEVLYETVLTTRLKVQRFLPFIAISAAAAPLLGLLGTVTGIMNTFKLITVFGTGDVKTLSSGISEALITTEYGLIVAIPSLLLHALLTRKAKSITDEMESTAIAFLNQVSRTQPTRRDRAA